MEINVTQLIGALKQCNPEAKIIIGTGKGEEELVDILQGCLGTKCIIATEDYIKNCCEEV